MKEENKKEVQRDLINTSLRIKNKKTLVIKQEPKEDDIEEVINMLEPKDLKLLYFFVLGILTTRGYKFVNS